MLHRSKAQLITHLPQANYLLPNFQFCQYFRMISMPKLKLLDRFLTIPFLSPLMIYVYFLEILSFECVTPCLNCDILTVTLLVHELTVVCLDYCNSHWILASSIHLDYYFHDATIFTKSSQ